MRLRAIAGVYILFSETLIIFNILDNDVTTAFSACLSLCGLGLDSWSC